MKQCSLTIETRAVKSPEVQALLDREFPHPEASAVLVETPLSGRLCLLSEAGPVASWARDALRIVAFGNSSEVRLERLSSVQDFRCRILREGGEGQETWYMSR